MNIRPLGDRIFVKRVEQSEKTEGGIFIPDTAQQKPMEGIVAAVGFGTYDKDGNRNKFHVKEGDRILFGKQSGTEIQVNGEEFVFLTEENIIGVLR